MVANAMICPYDEDVAKGAVRNRQKELQIAEELQLLFLRFGRLIRAEADQQLRGSGYPLHAAPLLGRLITEGPAVQRELAEYCAQHPAGVSRLLEELEEKGWVRRHRDEDDRRKVLVEATAEGRRHYQIIQKEMLSVLDHTFRALDGEDRATLRDLLHKALSAEPDGDCSVCASQGGSDHR